MTQESMHCKHRNLPLFPEQQQLKEEKWLNANVKKCQGLRDEMFMTLIPFELVERVEPAIINTSYEGVR